MDKTGQSEALGKGLSSLGIEVSEEALGGMLEFSAELLRWNAKVNLTAITEPAEVLEKHVIDSLAVLPEVRGARSLLDIGAGAGFPGVPLKLVLPELELTLVEAVGKKVAFMKAALVKLRLSGARAVQARAEGDPDGERLPRAEVVVCRALMDLPAWARLGPAYLGPGGRLVAMLGKSPSDAEVAQIAQANGLGVTTFRRYELPWSRAERSVVVFQRVES